MVRPAARREVAGHLQVVYGISERRACPATGFGRSSQRYRKRSDPSVALRMRLKELAAARVRYRYRRLHILSRPEGSPPQMLVDCLDKAGLQNVPAADENDTFDALRQGRVDQRSIQ